MPNKYFIGFDIGGSSVKAVLVKEKEIIKSKVVDLPKDLEKLLWLLKETKDEFIGGAENEVGGIGFGVAGIFDSERSRMLKSPNIHYLDNQPLAELFKSVSAPYPVKIEHDVHCFLLAEKEIGLAGHLKNIFYMTLGTGIGGAWMADGKIAIGDDGGAGEVGHMIIKNNGEAADLEELASNKFIMKKLGIGSIEAIKRAQAGDEKAREAFGELGKNLGIGLANVINIFDPDAVILAGGISEAKEFILPFIEKEIERFVISPAAGKTPILFSALGRFGGALGAALLFEKKE